MVSERSCLPGSDASEFALTTVAAVSRFLRQSLSWGSVKVDEIMLPLIKRQNERKQGNVKHQGNLGD